MHPIYSVNNAAFDEREVGIMHVHPKRLSSHDEFHPNTTFIQNYFHPMTSFIPQHFYPKQISSQNDIDVKTTANKTTVWWPKQCCHKHGHARFSAGDAPHEGLLQVVKREFRFLGFRFKVLGFRFLGFRV